MQGERRETRSAVDRIASALLTPSQKAKKTAKLLNPDSQGDAPAAAARALYFRKRVVLCTGPNNAAGVVFLGEALTVAGAQVGYVADESNGALLKKGIQDLHPELTPSQVDCMLHIFQSSHDGVSDNAAAKAEAHQVLQLADAVVAIGVPDAHADGAPRISEVVQAANAGNLLTVTVGKSSKGVTGATLAVKASQANAGACAVALILLKLRGKLADAITPDRYELLMSVQYGAGAMVGSHEGNPGMSIQEHKRLLTKLYKSVNRYERVPANLNTPTDVGVFDSSNGAFVAATVLKAELDKLGYPTNFIIVVDHGNAPYGEYTGDKEYQVSPNGEKEQVLYRLVSNGLKTTEEKGAALAIMACNTACTVPDAQNDVRMQVVDLILETADAMAKHGGDNPVMISTPVTALSPCYPEAVRKASNGAINLDKTPTPGSGPDGETGFANMIGAPRWAKVINNLEHLDPDRADEMKAMVKEIVDKVPEDATSVWLTCTHYPALQGMIQDALTERGLNIRVVNPMIYQAQAAAAALLELEKKNDPKLGKNLLANQDQVISSGGQDQLSLVRKSVDQLYRTTPVETTTFGQNQVQTLAAIRELRGRDANTGHRPSPFRELLSTISGSGNSWTPTFNAS